MNEIVDRVTRAVLYEGYLLYPYRASAVKNQHRWTFGALYPSLYSKAQGGFDATEMCTECLLISKKNALLTVQLRFLHLISRGDTGQAWQEGEEREVSVPPAHLNDLLAGSILFPFAFPQAQSLLNGVYWRQESVQGSIELSAMEVEDSVFKITARVRNESAFEGSERNEALLRSTVSTHIIFQVENGEFLSLLDPPPQFRHLIASCKNKGNWPVLIGENGETHTILASPIILYDYPQVAPESPGDLYDSTEIDEILMLRILTLTDAEKEEIRNVDDRARQLLERTENLPPEHFMKLHGAIRGMKKTSEQPQADPSENIVPWDPWEEEKKQLPSQVQVFGKQVKKGDRVRLWPVKSADILDLALKGRTAIVDSIEQDYDGRIHLAVVVEDDPGKDLGELRQPGHRFFFTSEEVEPL